MVRTVGLAHFSLSVSDVAKSIAFYRDILGMEMINRVGDRMAFLRCGKDIFVIVRSDNAVEAAAKTPEQCHQAFIVEARDFDESVHSLEQAGVDVVKVETREEFDSVFRGRSCYFRDPDGNVLEVIDLATTAHRPVERVSPASVS